MLKMMQIEAGESMTESIRFQFQNMDEANRAFETLAELGYRPVFDTNARRPGIYIRPYRQDLTSAMEIAHVFGGELDADQTAWSVKEADLHHPFQTGVRDWESY